jgi:hypothetical protein
MSGGGRIWLACVALLLSGSGAFAADETGQIRRIEIADPAHYWLDNGFVALNPAIRVSVQPGAETVVYLKIGAGGPIATRYLPGQRRYSLTLPPGSVADRVSFATDGAGYRTIDDVRGTRWDGAGGEYFHVYRPVSGGIDAPLAGYEWRRGDAAQQRAATSLLSDLIARTPAPFGDRPADAEDVERFRALNRCQLCHVADKPQARFPEEKLPPWATDGSGLYVPPAVLGDEAPLSDSDFFDDPNAGDRFVAPRCASAPATLQGRSGGHWYGCADGSLPIGRRDVAAGRAAGDPYTARLCASRRYLYGRLDALGRKAFAAKFAACGIG